MEYKLRFQHQVEKWMITNCNGQYIGLEGEVLYKPKYYKKEELARECLLKYYANRRGTTAN